MKEREVYLIVAYVKYLFNLNFCGVAQDLNFETASQMTEIIPKYASAACFPSSVKTKVVSR